jgi:hypothetical protein
MVQVQRIYEVIMKSCEIKSQVIAIMHGDCFTDVNYNSGKARLDIYHCEKNYDLLLKKKEILELINGVTVRITEKVDNRKLKSGLVRRGYRLQTNFSRYFFKIQAFPFKYIAKQLVKPEALAIMWQDDGTICRRSKTGMFSTATLATDGWELWKVQELRKAWNNAYGWCPAIMDYKCRGKFYIRLRLVANEAEKLTDIIHDLVVDSMKYKLMTFKTLASENDV